MALITEVQSRLSTERLKQLTNPDAREATTADTTRLQLACDDAQAEFELLAGMAFDSTSATHIAVGVQGVITYLLGFQGAVGEDYTKARSDWLAQLDRIRKTLGSAAWTAPQTTSNLDPSREDGSTQRPAFDPENLSDWQPNPLTRS